MGVIDYLCGMKNYYVDVSQIENEPNIQKVQAPYINIIHYICMQNNWYLIGEETTVVVFKNAIS